MLSEILIGVGCFLLGGFVGGLYVSHLITKVNDLYKCATGNDFVEWVLNTSKNYKKSKKSEETPVLNIEIEDEEQRKG